MARIVIVDDDDLITEIATVSLKRGGHMVSSVDHGDDAMLAIFESEPDLLILDYGLPGRTGMKILREVRALPMAANMPVMMLTSRHGKLHMLAAERDGADDYVTKPFDADALLERVEALLLGSRIACRAAGSAPAGQ